VTEQSFIPLGCIVERFEVLAWNDQRVHWRLRIDVAYNHTAFILMNEIAWYFSGDDFAKQAIGF
jgi:hypothetical protein